MPFHGCVPAHTLVPMQRRYHDLGTLLSFDGPELLEILTEDLGLTPAEAQRFLDAAPDAMC